LVLEEIVFKIAEFFSKETTYKEILRKSEEYISILREI
jgi:hypothetical protein